MWRGLYIGLAVLGVMLVVAAGVTAMVAYVPPGYATAVSASELAVAVVGIGLTWLGLTQARVAADYEVRVRRSPRDRNGTVDAVPEVSFACPECGRTYIASGQAAGLPFACRACDARFTVPRPTASESTA